MAVANNRTLFDDGIAIVGLNRILPIDGDEARRR